MFPSDHYKKNLIFSIRFSPMRLSSFSDETMVICFFPSYILNIKLMIGFTCLPGISFLGPELIVELKYQF